MLQLMVTATVEATTSQLSFLARDVVMLQLMVTAMVDATLSQLSFLARDVVMLQLVMLPTVQATTSQLSFLAWDLVMLLLQLVQATTAEVCGSLGTRSVSLTHRRRLLHLPPAVLPALILPAACLRHLWVSERVEERWVV